MNDNEITIRVTKQAGTDDHKVKCLLCLNFVKWRSSEQAATALVRAHEKYHRDLEEGEE
jgi:hypothetical protein